MDNRKISRRVPFVDPIVLRKLDMLINGKIDKVQTTSRSCTIIPSMVGRTIYVHNGKEYLPVSVVDEMVGYKLGEFSLTRKFSKHGGDKGAVKGKAGGKR